MNSAGSGIPVKQLFFHILLQRLRSKAIVLQRTNVELERSGYTWDRWWSISKSGAIISQIDPWYSWWIERGVWFACSFSQFGRTKVQKLRVGTVNQVW
jgi:hypothetical protein